LPAQGFVSGIARFDPVRGAGGRCRDYRHGQWFVGFAHSAKPSVLHLWGSLPLEMQLASRRSANIRPAGRELTAIQVAVYKTLLTVTALLCPRLGSLGNVRGYLIGLACTGINIPFSTTGRSTRVHALSFRRLRPSHSSLFAGYEIVLNREKG
jgi:hypothetical protein